MERRLFTSESVTEGHPDKICDQISDAVLTQILKKDPEAHVACECMVKRETVILAGEITTSAKPDYEKIARSVGKGLNYRVSDVINLLTTQSPEIKMAVDSDSEIGAGDQGMMFGYATRETDTYMPLPLALSHAIVRELATLRRENNQITYLRPDAKSQVTLEYSDDNKPVRIDSIVISTQHDPFDTEAKMLAKIKEDMIQILIPRIKQQYPNYAHLFDENIKYHINPTGVFVIGGPHGDTGLTGRKIIVDTYGGKGAHGGGAFSGKDPSKVEKKCLILLYKCI